MRYETLDKDQQYAILQNELRAREEEHFRLTVQNPDPEKDTVAYAQQNDLEERIKTLRQQLRVLRGEEKPAKKAAKRTKKAAKKVAAPQHDQGGTDGGQTNTDDN